MPGKLLCRRCRLSLMFDCLLEVMHDIDAMNRAACGVYGRK